MDLGVAFTSLVLIKVKFSMFLHWVFAAQIVWGLQQSVSCSWVKCKCWDVILIIFYFIAVAVDCFVSRIVIQPFACDLMTSVLNVEEFWMCEVTLCSWCDVEIQTLSDLWLACTMACVAGPDRLSMDWCLHASAERRGLDSPCLPSVCFLLPDAWWPLDWLANGAGGEALRYSDPSVPSPVSIPQPVPFPMYPEAACCLPSVFLLTPFHPTLPSLCAPSTYFILWHDPWSPFTCSSIHTPAPHTHTLLILPHPLWTPPTLVFDSLTSSAVFGQVFNSRASSLCVWSDV